MNQKSDVKNMVGLERVLGALPGNDYTLNAVFVYEDNAARKWAGEVANQVEKMAGKDSVRSTWWKMDDLAQPGVLAGAVSKAIRADILVVSANSSEGLPLPFYFWVNSWFPYRVPSLGLLVGLIGVPQDGCPYSGRLANYFKAVARKGRLDCLVEQRKLTAARLEIRRGNLSLADAARTSRPTVAPRLAIF